jgi:hypothetical protein
MDEGGQRLSHCHIVKSMLGKYGYRMSIGSAESSLGRDQVGRGDFWSHFYAEI